MLKVVKNNKGIIKMSEMNLGDVAVITDELSVHLGKIVMAMGDEKEGFRFVTWTARATSSVAIVIVL